jgi:ornithine cyclodeaminase/alanine dehydrogenase-like protein (mu-crystallin family)
VERAPVTELCREPAADLVLSLAEAMRAGLRSGAVRRMIVPPRETAEDAAGTKFISMPAVSPDYDLYINKVATIVAPGAPGASATVTSVVPMFSASSGRYLGALDGTVVTNLKCAAVTALVTDRCAAKNSGVLGIIGSGVQARQQYLGVSAVRDIREVRVFSPNPDHAAAFAADITVMAARAGAAPAGSAGSVAVCGSAEEASEGVDILITATVSSDPLPISSRLPGHVHVNCVGAHTVASRELSEDLLRTSLLIVEDRRTAVAEAGPLHSAALELDALDTPAAARCDRQRTVFSSTGCAYLDLITCAHLMTVDDVPQGRP